MVAKNQMNFEIRCHVRADPPIENLNFYWSAEGDNKTLESGERDGHYRADVESVVGNDYLHYHTSPSLNSWYFQVTDVGLTFQFWFCSPIR